ncbi:NAD(P)/FAD-dependent oxidoreductase [Alsobacter sp. R-9]
MQRDVVVLGAGIVGLSTALKVQETGRSVALIDRQEAGQGTSFGNAGILERASIWPYAFPRKFSEILSHALRTRADTNYHLSALPQVLPFLFRYWRASESSRHEKAMRGALPLIENCLSEHMPLVEAAGAQALLRPGGWIKLFRSEKTLADALAAAERVRPLGIDVVQLDSAGVVALEPNLSERMLGGFHYRDPVSVLDPAALSRAYLNLFEERGGAFLDGDASSLTQEPDGRWSIRTKSGTVSARDVVVALGPWADVVWRPLGYDLPMGVKRGYHMHYRPAGNAVLNHAVLDADVGYVLAPMNRGIRLTTGAEFALRDAPPTPVQFAKVEPVARKLFPLETRLDAKPWMGNRPCTPDMLPVIGPAPRHKGVWFAFGHAHHGLTLGAVTGRLIAEMISGEKPFIDPTPYSAARF